jgi:hypothetical protein
MAQTANPGFEYPTNSPTVVGLPPSLGCGGRDGIVCAADRQTLERRERSFRRWLLLASKLSDDVFSVLASLSRGGL